MCSEGRSATARAAHQQRSVATENALKEYQCRAHEGSTNKKTDPSKVGFLETHDSSLAYQFDGHRTDSKYGRNRKLD